MTRKEFIKLCGVLGVGLPLQATFTSCDDDDITTNFSGKVTIIGAGAGGLTTGYLLKQRGIDFQILEASSIYGGRMRRNTDFANFPIPLGAEWLHVETGVFEEIVNDSTIPVNVATTPYDPAVDFVLYKGREVNIKQIFDGDRKFINATWFDFFEQYIVPSVKDHIRYNEVVSSIDYSGDQIQVTTQNEVFTSDKVVVSVPVKMLQNGAITFTPELPSDKVDAIQQVKVWDGFKAFIEFSEAFYPAVVAFDTIPASAGQKLYYDAAYGQNTTQNILGLFSVGTEAQTYIQQSEEELINYMLDELDAIFDGKASATYIKHTFQNWNAEPYINGAYIYDQENWRRVRTLGKSVSDKVYFAGDAYTDGEDWSSVHAAARSAIRAVKALV